MIKIACYLQATAFAVDKYQTNDPVLIIVTCSGVLKAKYHDKKQTLAPKYKSS